MMNYGKRTKKEWGGTPNKAELHAQSKQGAHRDSTLATEHVHRLVGLGWEDPQKQPAL